MKSRNLNTTEFFKVLQLEYFSFKLRSLIYDRPEFVQMNRDIAERKKEKILLVAKKFRLISIFDSEALYKEVLEKEFYQEYGCPNFQYGADENKKASVLHWDKYYLFKPGTKVVYKKEVCKVKHNLPDEDSLVIATKNGNVTLPYIYVQCPYILTLLRTK